MTQPFPYRSFGDIGGNTVHLRIEGQAADAEPFFRDALLDSAIIDSAGRRSAYFRMGDGTRHEISEAQYTAWSRHGS